MSFQLKILRRLKISLAAENFVGELSAASPESIAASRQSLIVSVGEKDREKEIKHYWR